MSSPVVGFVHGSPQSIARELMRHALAGLTQQCEFQDTITHKTQRDEILWTIQCVVMTGSPPLIVAAVH